MSDYSQFTRVTPEEENPYASFTREDEEEDNPYAAFTREGEEFDPHNAPEQSTGEFAAGAAMDLAESALGVGDEIGAAALSVSDFFETGEWNWSENLTQARETLDTFDAQNPVLSGAITAAGVAGSLLIPAAGAARFAQTGSRLARAGKIGLMSSAEGAAYGALSGRGEEGRKDGAILGGVIGGVAGVGVSMLLRSKDEIAVMAKADDDLRNTPDQGHIAGKGFVDDAADNRTTRDNSKDGGVSNKERTVKKVVTQEEYDAAAELNGLSEKHKKTGFAGKWVNDVTSWITENVGERAARLTADAEWMQRTARGEWVGKIEDKLKGFDDIVTQHPRLSMALQNLGRTDDGKMGTWEDVYRAVGDNKELRDQVSVFQNMYKDLKALDAPGRTTFDWIHTSKMAGTPGAKAGGIASEKDYMGPAAAMIEYADEVTAANALAERFGINMWELPVTSKVKKGKARSAGLLKEKVNTKPLMEAVLQQIKKKAKSEGASDEVANNLDDALRTVFVSAKAGGDAAGAVARKVSSSAMLGSPMNAYLGISEWFTPMFQNGVVAWGKQVPSMVGYGLREVLDNWSQISKYSVGRGGVKFKGTVRPLANTTEGITPQNMGLGDQFMGEVAATSTSTFGKLMDRGVKFIYDKSLVTASNRIGQFAQMNSAVNRGRALAKSAMKGNAKSLEKLRKHDGMRGLNESEFDATMKALASGDKDNAWVRNYAGSALNMWQPVSATALPKGMADNPDMRMFYSMLTYQNRQANGMREKIGKPLLVAYERGLNTQEGRDAAKEAMLAGARYTAYYGMFAGMWERHRSSLDPSRDIDTDELWTAEGITEATKVQMVSNLSSGLVDLRAKEYGASPVDFTPAPVQWGGKVASGLGHGAVGMLSGENPMDPEEDNMKQFYRMLQGQVPGIATMDKMNRVLNDGERLIVQPKE